MLKTNIVVSITFSIAIILFLSSCGQNKKPFKEEKKQDSTVLQVFNLDKGLFNSNLDVPGELLPFQQVDLYAKENSFVKKMWVDVGSEVKAGQLLINLEAPEIGSQLAGAQARIKAQEAVLFASRASYKRLLETSLTPGTISKNDLEQSMAKKNSDSAQLLSLMSAYKEIAQQKDYLEVHAPFSGVISARNVYAGALVGPSGKGSDLPLLVLEEHKKLRLVISAPALYSGQLHLGDQVVFKVISLPSRTFHAIIMRMAGSLDSKLRAERIEMDVKNTSRELIPGMPVEVNLPLKSRDSTFVIPQSALVTSTDGTFVIKVADGEFQRIPVLKGEESAGHISISGPLFQGDKLVLEAKDEMRQGSSSGKIKEVPLSSKRQ